MNIDHYQNWLDSESVDKATKKTLREMKPEERSDAFFKSLEFGTAGMRGLLGPGTNRMNFFTVDKATIGFGLYVLEKFPQAATKGLVIAHDNRHMSHEFTLRTAEIFNLMGIKAFIFDSLRPTPQLSFAIRHLGAVGGVVITASHNPKEYNGYKVYDENGCQLTPIRIERLIEIIASLPDELTIKVPLASKRAPLIILGPEIDDIYLKKVKAIQIHPELNKSLFSVVFSPQHGASCVLGPRLLKECGYQVLPVVAQCIPDPDFSSTKTPNPEEPAAYEEPIKLALEKGASLIVITDPDADRVGVAYKDKTGSFQLLTGNESGALLIDYVIGQRKKLGLLSPNGVVYDTIVTSPLGAKIARFYGCNVETFLTGFKYIGDRIDFYEKSGGPHFEFGYEESYGCLIAPFARDKDGLQALLMYSEMALFHHLRGKNLGEAYDELQKIHGYHRDQQFSISFKGVQGQKEMEKLLFNLRTFPFKSIGSWKVVRFDDYLTSKSKTLDDEQVIHLPSADVAKFFLHDGSTITVRPSGTEPKCKFYYSVVGHFDSEVKEKVIALKKEFSQVYGL